MRKTRTTLTSQHISASFAFAARRAMIMKSYPLFAFQFVFSDFGSRDEKNFSLWFFVFFCACSARPFTSVGRIVCCEKLAGWCRATENVLQAESLAICWANGSGAREEDESKLKPKEVKNVFVHQLLDFSFIQGSLPASKEKWKFWSSKALNFWKIECWLSHGTIAVQKTKATATGNRWINPSSPPLRVVHVTGRIIQLSALQCQLAINHSRRTICSGFKVEQKLRAIDAKFFP